MHTIFDRANARPAPGGDVQTPEGTAIALREIWGASDYTALIFTRHFGCLFCRQQVANLSRSARALNEAGLAVAIIGPAWPDHARAFIEETRPPFPVYCDPEGTVYRAYGLEQSRPSQIFRPDFAVATARALAEGARQRGTMGRPRQLPGAAIIDRDGSLRLHQVARHPADHMTGAQLVKAIGSIRELDDHATTRSSM